MRANTERHANKNNSQKTLPRYELRPNVSKLRHGRTNVESRAEKPRVTGRKQPMTTRGVQAVASSDLLGGCDELFDAHTGLTEDTGQGTHLQLPMNWHNASPTVRMTKHYMTPALPDLMKPQLTECSYRVSSGDPRQLRHGWRCRTWSVGNSPQEPSETPRDTAEWPPSGWPMPRGSSRLEYWTQSRG